MKKTMVIKRNGELAVFQKEKIANAIEKAMLRGSFIFVPNLAEKIANEIENEAKENFNVTFTISDIEKMVFEKLAKYNQLETAKAYESYRSKHEILRQTNSLDKSIEGLLSLKDDDLVMENSNKNAMLLSTQRDLMAGEISKDLSKRKLFGEDLIQAHEDGVIHIHDMDYAIMKMHNCGLYNIQDMLDNGTGMGDKLIESPHRFSTACTIVSQIIHSISSSSYGGQSITIRHIAPYLRKSKLYFEEMFSDLDAIEKEKVVDKLLKKELRDGIQTLRYQLNTLANSNGQTPFVTIYLEIVANDEYEEEMALICEEMIRQRIEGMKNHKGQVIGEAFPKLVYLLDEHNCLEGGKYDYITKLAAKCNTKRLVPDYQSAKIIRENYGDVFPPMRYPWLSSVTMIEKLI